MDKDYTLIDFSEVFSGDPPGLLRTRLKSNPMRTLRAWIVTFTLRFRWSTFSVFRDFPGISNASIHKAFRQLVRAGLLNRVRVRRFVVYRPTKRLHDMAEFLGLHVPSYGAHVHLQHFEHAHLIRRTAAFLEYSVSGFGISYPGHFVTSDLSLSFTPDAVFLGIVPEVNHVVFAVQVEMGTRNPRQIRESVRKELRALQPPSRLSGVLYTFPDAAKDFFERRYREYFRTAKPKNFKDPQRHSLGPRPFQLGVLRNLAAGHKKLFDRVHDFNRFLSTVDPLKWY